MATCCGRFTTKKNGYMGILIVRTIYVVALRLPRQSVASRHGSGRPTNGRFASRPASSWQRTAGKGAGHPAIDLPTSLAMFMTSFNWPAAWPAAGREKPADQQRPGRPTNLLVIFITFLSAEYQDKGQRRYRQFPVMEVCMWTCAWA